MNSLIHIFDYENETNRATIVRNGRSQLLSKNRDMLPPEIEQGNVEYKLKLINPSPNRLQQLVTQMKWRLEEGDGEAIYEIGVEDNGQLKGLTQDEIDLSMQTLNLMAKKIGASVNIINERIVDYPLNSNNGKRRKAIEVLVRKINEDRQTAEVRIVVLGNFEAGKSSLLGVLTQGEMDNGRGRARLNLFRHRHEIRTGRTSSINKEILGFDSSGSPITYHEYQSQEEICQLSSKLIVFIDSGGHQKYLKTTVFSLTAMHADYAILVVNALTGIDAGTNKQHLSLALALELPIIVVLNKIDLCQSQLVEQQLDRIKELISSSFCGHKMAIIIEKVEDVVEFWNRSKTEHVVPIFLVSCVNGLGIDLLYKFFQMLKPSMKNDDREKLTKQKTLFQIDETFNIQNVGMVVSGFLSSGQIEEGNILQAGPTYDGSFITVYVNGLQRHKVSRRTVRPGESSTLALETMENCSLEKIIRKGMVLLSQCELNTKSVCVYFEAHIFVMSNSCEISIAFQAMVYTENVRQLVSIVAIQDRKCISSNESASVILQFTKHPEYVQTGYRLLIQQGTTKAVGRVTRVFPYRLE